MTKIIIAKKIKDDYVFNIKNSSKKVTININDKILEGKDLYYAFFKDIENNIKYKFENKIPQSDKDGQFIFKQVTGLITEIIDDFDNSI